MNELELIRDFRVAVPSPTADARAAALERLTSRWEHRRWRLVGRRRLLLAAALLIAVLATGTAVALGDRVMDLVRGKPAPTSISKGPLSTFGPQRFPANMPEEARRVARGYEVIGEWRGVLGLRTSLGPLTLWKATARNRTVCWFFVWTNKDVTRPVYGAGEGGCDHPGWRSGDPWSNDRNGRVLKSQFPRGRPTLVVQISPFFHTRREIVFLRGRTALEIRQVEIRFRDGRRRRIGVYDTFFAAEVPPGSFVRRLVPLDARGRAVPCNYTRFCSWPEGPPP